MPGFLRRIPLLATLALLALFLLLAAIVTGLAAQPVSVTGADGVTYTRSRGGTPSGLLVASAFFFVLTLAALLDRALLAARRARTNGREPSYRWPRFASIALAALLSIPVALELVSDPTQQGYNDSPRSCPVVEGSTYANGSDPRYLLIDGGVTGFPPGRECLVFEAGPTETGTGTPIASQRNPDTSDWLGLLGFILSPLAIARVLQALGWWPRRASSSAINSSLDR